MLILDLLPLLSLFGVVVRRDLGSRGRMRFGGVRLRELVLAGKSVLVNVYGKARHDDDDEK